jgi:hypothetical protein
MSEILKCVECGEPIDEHYHCQQVTAMRLREAMDALDLSHENVKTCQAYIGQLEDALASTFTKVVDIFETLEKEVGETLPEKHSFFKECIATLKKVVSDHEEEKGKKNATAN